MILCNDAKLRLILKINKQLVDKIIVKWINNFD